MFDRFFNFFTYDLGIDMGTANTRIFVVGKGVAVREPTVIARNKKTKEVVAVGQEAKRMLGRTPGQLEAIRPLAEGVISDFDGAAGLLSHYFKELHQSYGLRIKIPKPKVAISVPADLTDVERKAVADAAFSAGARSVYLIEEPLATAIGADLPIFEAVGALLVDIGSGITKLSVISLGGIVVNKSLAVAGDKMDEAIVNFLRLKYSLLIGLPTAENLKTQIGSAKQFRDKEERQAVVRGRDLSTGLPRSLRVNSGEIREALFPLLNQILAAISDIVEETPPELLGDITQKGILLSGGVAQLPFLDELVAEETKIPCFVLKDPMLSTVRGCGKVLTDEKLLQKVRIRGGAR